MSLTPKLTLCSVVSVLLASALAVEGKQPHFNPVWEEYQESAKEMEEQMEAARSEMEQKMEQFQREQKQAMDNLEREMDQLHRAYQKSFPRHREIELRPEVIPPEPRNGLVIPIPHSPQELSKLELLARKRLSRQEFDQLRQEVKTIDDYRYVVQLRGLYYPKLESAEFNSDFRLNYGSPLITHNRGHGVCDELALYFAAFFIDKPKYELHLFVFEEAKLNKSHALTIFKDPQNNWGFSDNLEVPLERYFSRKEAVSAALAHSGYEPKDTIIFQTRIKPGNWVYEDDISKRLRRKLLPQ